MRIPFSPPDISELEINEVVETLRSGWISTGPRTKTFEKKIADYVGAPRTVCLSSATAALELTLRMLGIGPGDEVIVPAYTYTASAEVISHVGAKIVMVDVERDTYEIGFDEVEAAINENTKAIMGVDIGGKICDYDSLIALAESKKDIFVPKSELQKIYKRIDVIADAAHSFGSKKNGVQSGLHADISCFSFHAVKSLTTGEGGAVVWKPHPDLDDERMYMAYTLASLHGQTKDAFTKNQIGEWEYDIIELGYKHNMTDIAAAIGIRQLDRYPQLIERRQSIIKKYDEVFLPMGLKSLVHIDEENFSNGHLYMLNIEGATLEDRNEIIRHMGERGVACNVHFKPLPMLTAYMKKGFDIGDFPNAYAKFENEISLPLYSKMSDEEVDFVIESFKQSLNETMMK